MRQAARRLGLVSVSLDGLAARKLILEVLKDSGMTALAATEAVGRLEALKAGRNSLISLLEEFADDAAAKQDPVRAKVAADIGVAIARLAQVETDSSKHMVELESALSRTRRPQAAQIVAPPGATVYVAVRDGDGSGQPDRRHQEERTRDLEHG